MQRASEYSGPLAHTGDAKTTSSSLSSLPIRRESATIVLNLENELLRRLMDRDLDCGGYSMSFAIMQRFLDNTIDTDLV